MRQIAYCFSLLMGLNVVAAGVEATISVWAQNVSPEALAAAKILDGLTRGGITSKRMATLVEERGVDFNLTPEIEKALRDAGAGDDLIQALKMATVKSKAALIIDTDADCTVTVNGVTFDMKAGEGKILVATVGENVIRAVSKRDTSVNWLRVVQVQPSEQRAVLIELGTMLARDFVAGTTETNSKDGQKYVWISPGRFDMGCSEGDSECAEDETPRHSIAITKGFWLGQTPVTQPAYQRVIGSNPSKFRGEQLPVETVSWDQAKAYCEAVGGRLPTEAEWEYAARAGSKVDRYGDIDAIAWYFDNSGNTRIDSTALRKTHHLDRLRAEKLKVMKVNGNSTHPVRLKQPNAGGLYDMLGNIWEWVEDRYDEKYYAKSPSADPTGPTSGQYRVVRGGSWFDGPWDLRSSNRLPTEPSQRYNNVGFRCARAVFP